MLSREEINKDLEKEIDHEKKMKISKIIIKIIFTILIILISLFCYMYFIGTKYLKTNEIIIKSNIPESFKGIKILHISDILYDSISEKEIISLKNECQNISADLVIFTGGLFNKEYTPTNDDIKLLNDLFVSIPYKLGKYAVRSANDTTNFDLIMDNTNFIILDNEMDMIYNETNEGINIIGLTGTGDTITTNDIYTITLINNYDLYQEYQLSSNLVLAGNNLGGEIQLFGLPLVSRNKYMNNYYRENNTQVYISSGIGTQSHLRFMNHPSVNVYRMY